MRRTGWYKTGSRSHVTPRRSSSRSAAAGLRPSVLPADSFDDDDRARLRSVREKLAFTSHSVRRETAFTSSSLETRHRLSSLGSPLVLQEQSLLRT